ncbi:prefoldin subunit beta [Candidatus Woesearchaeota archaeon]|jgi:prefoldin beta subunit|nr:prefoldin subunit beta [Candidatus Woesearchaeota archaeon]MBT5215695.1 prefoldin subunit beta [Candidatus Woesearchaeota archaeon]MBT6401990.1 prefoldin subunit beta [Candidatus Woesearchaeota archaeon]
MTANIESEISKLQLLEQNLKGIEMQKQNVQLQLFESENSLKELEGYEGKPFKIIGPVMIESNKDDLVKDLKEKIDLLKVRSESMGKQETSLKKDFEEIQAKIMENLNQSQKNN